MSAKQRSLERLLSKVTIHVTLRSGHDDFSGRSLTIQTRKCERDPIEFHTWDVELAAESGDQSCQVEAKPGR
jgi:hypothetical protein